MAAEDENGEFYLHITWGIRGSSSTSSWSSISGQTASFAMPKTHTMIRDEVFLTPIMKEDANSWPEPDWVGRQELEIVMGNEHISFTTSKIGSLVDVQSCKDPEGLRIFYFLVQDLKCSVFSLISLHFKIKPI